MLVVLGGDQPGWRPTARVLVIHLDRPLSGSLIAGGLSGAAAQLLRTGIPMTQAMSKPLRLSNYRCRHGLFVTGPP
jgi:hypothetical protein